MISYAINMAMNFYILMIAFVLPYTSFLYANWETTKRETKQFLPQICGWFTPEKADKIMDFIYEKKPQLCVEIGTFGGSATFAMARTLQALGSGVLYAIDAWDPVAAVEGLESNDPNIPWWSSQNFQAVYRSFLHILTHYNLLDYCYPVRARSNQAVHLFLDESIDLLYVDGNFSSEGSLEDVTLFFPKVKKGGAIWINDSHYPSKNEAVAFLMKYCTWLKKYSLKNQLIVFEKE